MASAGVYNKALDLLSRREHSRKELYIKLTKRFDCKDEINLTLDQLEENNLLCDSRFTEEYVHSRRRKGFGPVKISMELEKKGVKDSLISSEIDKFNDWDKLAELSFKKRFPDGASKNFKELQKQKNFLTNKGFSFYQIESVLD
jgi:regulatory protein|tara:strand:- start:2869 stop:3300 length:432 start_codon:yes stop_codon:yes gene_type:complete